MMEHVVLAFASNWFSKPTLWANVGIVLGILVFLEGVIWKHKLHRILGLVVLGCSIIAGVVQYILGNAAR